MYIHYCSNDFCEEKDDGTYLHQGYVNSVCEGSLIASYFFEDILNSKKLFLQRKVKTIFKDERKLDMLNSIFTKIFWKTNENLKNRPKRIILVRHGESEANVNNNLYSNTPDWLIHLTEKGRNQAREVGKKIKELVGDEPVYFYYSPFTRTRETFECISESFGGKDNVPKSQNQD